MPDEPDNDRNGAGNLRNDDGMSPSSLEAWFMREVWPLEAILMQYLRQNWRDQSAAVDLLHDVYVQVYEAASRQVPENPKAFVLTTARNLLIDRVRSSNVVPIDALADFESIQAAIDAPGPEQVAIARDELRRLEGAIAQLPPRCRQVVLLRRVEGLSRREIASRLSISEDTVSVHLKNGMSALADLFYGRPRDKGALFP
jgi:RNA polymerase sigma factor (sigma-70 family)